MSYSPSSEFTFGFRFILQGKTYNLSCFLALIKQTVLLA